MIAGEQPTGAMAPMATKPSSNTTHLDLRRRDQVARSGPQDHAGKVHVLPNPRIDIDKTIFRTADEAAKASLKTRFCVEIFWSESAIAEIDQATAETLERKSAWAAMPKHNAKLLTFMGTECDFAVEHADGSFLDHLQFCYEYGVAHLPGSVSAMPLFLHSIMGVGTNLFPMALEKRDQLASFLTTEEVVHIEAFPTVNRLLSTGLLKEMAAMDASELDDISGLECSRMIGPNMHERMQSDNAPIRLTREQLWIQLNYQLIHLLDFIPVERWEERVGEIKEFAVLHALLRRAGKLIARIEFDSDKWVAVAATCAGNEVKERMLRAYSAQIGHRLEYKLMIHPAH